MKNNGLDKEITDAQVIEETKSPELTEVQMAMCSFEQYLDLFAKKLQNSGLSKQSIIRAWRNGTLTPLNKIKLHFSYPEEKELYDLFTEVNSSKLVLMMYGLEDAGVIKILKPLMSANEISKTDSEKQLDEINKTFGDQKLESEITHQDLVDNKVINS